MTTVNKLPNFQFPGQVVIDAYGCIYVYDEKSDCYVNTGTIENIPESSFDTAGLMTAIHKGKLDKIPEKAGGFAIILDQRLRPNSQNNPDGLIYGTIKLTSESIDITCIDTNGEEIKGGCSNCVDGAKPPGLDFKLSEKFLQVFCAKLPVIPGPRGDKGDQGDQGEPGTGDGPVGLTGIQGKSYDTAGTFTGVKVFDVDGVYDKAVVNLDLDKENGILTVVKSKVTASDENTAADQVYCTPIFRDVQFNPEFPKCGKGGDLWKYNIVKGDDDLDNDVYIYTLPDQFVVPGESEVSIMLLSQLIDAIINDLKLQYDAAISKYDEQIKQFIYDKDADSRQKICVLAKQLSECEWELPLEYCVGIMPCDAGGGTPGVEGEGWSAAGKTAARMNKAVEKLDEMVQVGPFSPCPQSSSSQPSSSSSSSSSP